MIADYPTANWKDVTNSSDEFITVIDDVSEVMEALNKSLNEFAAVMRQINWNWRKKQIDKLISRLKSISSIQEFKIYHQKESKQIIKQSYYKPVHFYLRLSPVSYSGKNFCKV